MTHRTRVPSPAVVATIAAANHVQPTETAYAASVRVAGEVYFWAAA